MREGRLHVCFYRLVLVGTLGELAQLDDGGSQFRCKLIEDGYKQQRYDSCKPDVVLVGCQMVCQVQVVGECGAYDMVLIKRGRVKIRRSSGL